MSEATTQVVTITLQQEQDYAFRIQFDGTELDDLTTDEPAPLGHDQGPNPSRLLLAAVANCLSASMLFAMRKFKNNPGPLRTVAKAELGRNEEGRMRIMRMDVQIYLAEVGASHQQLERILGQFEKFCVVTESVRHGIPVAVSVADASAQTLWQSPAEA